VVPAEPPYDMLVLDNKFKALEISEILAKRALCKDMLVFVDGAQLRDLRRRLNPTDIIHIRGGARRKHLKRLNYMFLCQQT